MRRFFKFLHTIGAIGFMGAMASMLVMLFFLPTPSASLAQYTAVRCVMGAVATWVFLPSMTLVLISGLLAIAFHPPFHNAGWAWLKLATGILVFEGGLTAIHGPIQHEAAWSASALAGQVDPSLLARSIGTEKAALWVLFAVAAANVVLGIWRPRLSRARRRVEGGPELSRAGEKRAYSPLARPVEHGDEPPM